MHRLEGAILSEAQHHEWRATQRLRWQQALQKSLVFPPVAIAVALHERVIKHCRVCHLVPCEHTLMGYVVQTLQDLADRLDELSRCFDPTKDLTTLCTLRPRRAKQAAAAVIKTQASNPSGYPHIYLSFGSCTPTVLFWVFSQNSEPSKAKDKPVTHEKASATSKHKAAPVSPKSKPRFGIISPSNISTDIAQIDSALCCCCGC